MEFKPSTNSENRKTETISYVSSSTIRRSGNVLSFCFARRERGQAGCRSGSSRDNARMYIYECRMQITVNPIGHFLRVRLCAREPSDSSRLRSPFSKLVWIGFMSITNCSIASSVFRILPPPLYRRRGRVPFSGSCLL